MRATRFDRFRIGSALYKCIVCDKATRETGYGESKLDLCLRCMKMAEVENTVSDYGINSPEHLDALAAVPKA